jgi:hypothetical protein
MLSLPILKLHVWSISMIKNITSKGSIALRAGRANARRCFGRYSSNSTLLNLKVLWKK